MTTVWLNGKKFGLKAYTDNCIKQVYGQNIVGNVCRVWFQDGIITRYK